MPLSLFKDLSRPRLLDIVLLLKRHPGLSVTEMSGALRMSYMGVKQHCMYLEKLKYLATSLRPKAAPAGKAKKGGRPEKIYRLTDKIRPLFPDMACDLVNDLLASADEIGGTGMSTQLLAAHYALKLKRYQDLVKGRTLLEKAQALARLRQVEGCVSSCDFDVHNGLRLVEFHSPIAKLCLKYPQARDMEAAMLGDLLNCAVERAETVEGSVTRIEFRLKTKPSAEK
jgi:predicted ArsR family transcriptional regulator